MPAQTTHTIVDPDTLLAQIRRSAQLGYAVDDGEQEIGVRCIAVPCPRRHRLVRHLGVRADRSDDPGAGRPSRPTPAFGRGRAVRGPLGRASLGLRVTDPDWSSRPRGASPTRSPRSQVSRTTPRRVRPSYALTGLRCRRAWTSTVNSSSGANATRSASKPAAIVPFDRRPTSSAGRPAIHRATSASDTPRAAAAVHTTGSDSCSEAIPPQAAPKSPVSRRFSSGVQGSGRTPRTRGCRPRVRPTARPGWPRPAPEGSI